MTTEEALLAAIWASPHDDLPRLVYADWCDENGQPERAEFIRVQCELARMEDDDSRRPELKATETHLWNQHAKSFQKGLMAKMVNEPFRRGFVAPQRRRIALEDFLNWTEEKLNQAPLWEFQVYFHPPERIARLTRNPRFQRLSFLGLWAMNDLQAMAVAGSPHAVNLTGIHCRHGVMTATGVWAITRSPHLQHLTELIIDTTVVNVPFATVLIDSPMAERLKWLDLRNSDRIDPDALDLLAEKFPGRLLVGDRLT